MIAALSHSILFSPKNTSMFCACPIQNYWSLIWEDQHKTMPMAYILNTEIIVTDFNDL